MSAAAPAALLRRLRDEPGFALSLLLHLAMLAAALWYVALRPALPPQRRTVPVDLVLLTPAPGSAGAAPASPPGAPRAQREAAPVREGVAPRATAQPEDELSAKLRALAQLRSPDTALAMGGGEGESGASGNGAYALKDFIRAQILRRWLPDLAGGTARGMPVLLHVTLTRAGVITEARVADAARFANDVVFRGMALSARDAALLASPIQMPPGNFPAIIKLDIDLDPKAALR